MLSDVRFGLLAAAVTELRGLKWCDVSNGLLAAILAVLLLR
jgi:hypothetical protein